MATDQSYPRLLFSVVVLVWNFQPTNHLFGTSVASRASRRYFLSGRLEFRELGLLGSTSAERLPIDLQRNVSAACRAVDAVFWVIGSSFMSWDR